MKREYGAKIERESNLHKSIEKVKRKVKRENRAQNRERK